MRIDYRQYAADLIHLIGEEETADHGSQHSGKAQMLTDQIYQKHIQKCDQDIADRIPGNLNQLKHQKRYDQCHGCRSKDLFYQKHHYIAVAAVRDQGSYKNEQRNTDTIVKQRFVLNDRAYIFGEADLIQDAGRRDRIGRRHHASQQDTGPEIQRQPKRHRREIQKTAIQKRGDQCRQKSQQTDRTQIGPEFSHIDFAGSRKEHKAQHAVHQVLPEIKITETADQFMQRLRRKNIAQQQQKKG